MHVLCADKGRQGPNFAKKKDDRRVSASLRRTEYLVEFDVWHFHQYTQRVALFS